MNRKKLVSREGNIYKKGIEITGHIVTWLRNNAYHDPIGQYEDTHVATMDGVPTRKYPKPTIAIQLNI